MKYAFDLHIHSALSPCADDDMTPNNIVNMAVLKGLDLIALTDHNSAANLEAAACCARKAGLLFLPGIEVETSEEVHLVCLFPDTGSALKLSGIVREALPGIQNRKDIFGRQLVMDEHDVVTGEVGQLLVTASELSIDEVFRHVGELGGVVIPAHVDRPSYSILSNLGILPETLSFKYLEISRSCGESDFRSRNPGLDGYRLIRSSDAHCLGDILERESFLELDRLSVMDVLDALRPELI